MNTTNSSYDWQLYHQLNKTSSKLKFHYKMKTYIPKDDSDDLSPNYLYSLTATDLLVAIVKKQIDPAELAHRELGNRGLDDDGKWVGFKKVKAIECCLAYAEMLDFSRIRDRSGKEIFVWL